MRRAARRELGGDRRRAPGRRCRPARSTCRRSTLKSGHVPADVARRGEHVAQVGRAVLVGRRADGDELELAVRDGGVDVGGEVQAPGVARCARPSSASPGSWIGMPPRCRSVDLARVDVDAQHVVAHFGEAGAGDQADVAGADHRDLQTRSPIEALMSSSAARGSDAAVMARPTDEVVGAGGDGGLWRHHADLIVRLAARGTNARSNKLEVFTALAAQDRGLLRGAHDAVEAAGLCELAPAAVPAPPEFQRRRWPRDRRHRGW